MENIIHIKSIISGICKRYNIPYSGEQDIKDIPSDVIIIGKIILHLREIQDLLREIEEKHSLDGIKNILEDDIFKLSEVAHSLSTAGQKILCEEKLIKNK